LNGCQLICCVSDFQATESEDELSDVELRPDEDILGTEMERGRIELIKKCHPQEMLGPLHVELLGDVGTPMSRYFAEKSGKLGALGDRTQAEDRVSGYRNVLGFHCRCWTSISVS
jgi:hypothetical protein